MNALDHVLANECRRCGAWRRCGCTDVVNGQIVAVEPHSERLAQVEPNTVYQIIAFAENYHAFHNGGELVAW